MKNRGLYIHQILERKPLFCVCVTESLTLIICFTICESASFFQENHNAEETTLNQRTETSPMDDDNGTSHNETETPKMDDNNETEIALMSET